MHTISDAAQERSTGTVIRWNLALIRKRMDQRKWENAHQLSEGARLTYPLANRILNPTNPPLEHVSVRTIAQLAAALGVHPFSVLTVEVPE